MPLRRYFLKFFKLLSGVRFCQEARFNYISRTASVRVCQKARFNYLSRTLLHDLCNQLKTATPRGITPRCTRLTFTTAGNEVFSSGSRKNVLVETPHTPQTPAPHALTSPNWFALYGHPRTLHFLLLSLPNPRCSFVACPCPLVLTSLVGRFFFFKKSWFAQKPPQYYWTSQPHQS